MTASQWSAKQQRLIVLAFETVAEAERFDRDCATNGVVAALDRALPVDGEVRKS